VDAFARRLGRTIRRYRLAAGLSQEALAERSDLHRTYVSLVERGRSNVTVEALVRIGHAVGVPASHLLAEAETDFGTEDHSGCVASNADAPR
jgi:transcriptional regulator with XRE-family HTH domain